MQRAFHLCKADLFIITRAASGDAALFVSGIMMHRKHYGGCLSRRGKVLRWGWLSDSEALQDGSFAFCYTVSISDRFPLILCPYVWGETSPTVMDAGLSAWLYFPSVWLWSDVRAPIIAAVLPDGENKTTFPVIRSTSENIMSNVEQFQVNLSLLKIWPPFVGPVSI